jgi:hypothetical protein
MKHRQNLIFKQIKWEIAMNTEKDTEQFKANAKSLATAIRLTLLPATGKFYAMNRDFMFSESPDPELNDHLSRYNGIRADAIESMPDHNEQFDGSDDPEWYDKNEDLINAADNLVYQHFANITSLEVHRYMDLRINPNTAKILAANPGWIFNSENDPFKEAHVKHFKEVQASSIERLYEGTPTESQLESAKALTIIAGIMLLDDYQVDEPIKNYGSDSLSM